MITTVTVGNEHVARSFTIADGRLRTERLIHGTQGSTSYAVAPDSDEFVIDLVWEPLAFRRQRQNPVQLSAADFRVVSAPSTGTVVPSATFDLEQPDLGLLLRIEVEVDGERPWLRKRLRLQPSGTESVTLQRFVVESLRLHAPAPHHGGFGQPLYWDDWFAGVEYPASDNCWLAGTVACAHDGDGFVPVGGEAVSESVVWGAAGQGGVRHCFLDYVERIRAQPVQRYVHYNSWYDLQGADLNQHNLLERIARLKQELIDGRGVRLAGFVIDDHWDDRSSVWTIDGSKFPDGFHPLTRAAETAGMDLGLWFGPVGGYDEERAERITWYQSQGYEVSTNGEYLCLAGARYHPAFLGQLEEKLADYRLGYLKLDGMAFGCLGEGHGHAPGLLSRQALVRALVRILEAARAIRPDVFLSITTGTWLSPWWLRWADAIFIGGHDYGWSHDLPSREDREAAITYRDGVLYEDFQVHHDQVPFSSLMSVGVIKGALNLLGGADESSDAWRRELAMEFGRGIMQTELYLSPQLLSAGEWDQLAQAIRWAEEHDRVLLHDGRMVLGDPRKGEIYGYLHCGETQAIIVLRNPSYRPQPVDLPLGAWYEPVQREPHVLWQLSPERRILALDAAQEALTHRLWLQPFEVVVLACQPRAQGEGVFMAGIPFNAAAHGATWHLPATGAEVRLAASAATNLQVTGRGDVHVGRDITTIRVGASRRLEERWGALLRTGANGRTLEATWALDPSVAAAELVAVGEWDAPLHDPEWALSGSNAPAYRLSIRSGPTGRWGIAAVQLTEQAGSVGLALPDAAGRISLWLWLQRKTDPVEVRCTDIPFIMPTTPTVANEYRLRETHRLWASGETMSALP